MRWFGWLRRKPKPIPLPDLTPYRGNWVAVKGGVLVAVAPTANALMETLTSDELFKGSTAWFEEHPEKVMRWSVQYPSRPGYVCPNCLFSTQESAERWIKSWARADEEQGTVWTRDGQHDPWYEVSGNSVLTEDY